MLKGKIPVTVAADLINDVNDNMPVFVSGRLLALLTLGKDNEGLITRREYLQYFTTLSIETGAPLIADAQSGFGNELSAWTAADELGSAGASYMVLNDQSWPATSLQIAGAKSTANYLNMVKAAVDGARDYDLQVIPKLEGASVYGYAGLAERIRSLLQLGIEQIAVSRLHQEELDKLGDEPFFAQLGVALDDENISLAQAEIWAPAFILPVRQTIDRIEEMNSKILHL